MFNYRAPEKLGQPGGVETSLLKPSGETQRVAKPARQRLVTKEFQSMTATWIMMCRLHSHNHGCTRIQERPGRAFGF
jgi:hypothetical protein